MNLRNLVNSSSRIKITILRLIKTWARNWSYISPIVITNQASWDKNLNSRNSPPTLRRRPSSNCWLIMRLYPSLERSRNFRYSRRQVSWVILFQLSSSNVPGNLFNTLYWQRRRNISCTKARSQVSSSSIYRRNWMKLSGGSNFFHACPVRST